MAATLGQRVGKNSHSNLSAMLSHGFHCPSRRKERLLPKRPSRPETHPTEVSPEPGSQLQRLASLCGDGEIPFPSDLPPQELRTLAQLVRQHRRARLLDFLATRVAESIHEIQGNGPF